MLHPCSLTKGCLQRLLKLDSAESSGYWKTYLQVRIRADDIASSTTCLIVRLPSFLASSQLNGTWVSFWHSLQLVFSHLGFKQRNSLSTSMGGHSALKSQNGHSLRKSNPAAARSSCCCRCSRRSKDLVPRKSRSCLRVKVPPHAVSAKQTGRHFDWPISPSTYVLAHFLQKKWTVSPLQHVMRLIGHSS